VQSNVSFVGVGLKSVLSKHPPRLRPVLAGAAALIAALLAGLPAQAAGPVTIVTKYDLTIAGIPLGGLKFHSDIDGRSYTLSGHGESSRLVKLIANYEGRAKSAGALAGVQVLPADYELKFRGGDKKQSVDMHFADGAIDQLEIHPPAKPSRTSVPVEPMHRVGVIDPMSALIMPLPQGEIDGESACNRRLPIFDGRYRYDVVLSFKRTETVRTGGKSKQRMTLYVCKIKYEPIAGHKPTRKTTIFWQSNEGMEMWLAPVVSAGLFVPYRVVAPARIGTVVLSLSKLKVSEQQQQAAITPDE